MAIKAVIFDWGGVLIEDPTENVLRHCAEALGIAEKIFGNVYRRHTFAFSKGLAEDEFWSRMCSDLGVSPPPGSLWGEAFAAAYRENEEMFSLASALKRHGFKIGLLSNSELPSMDFFYGKKYAQFDAVVFSCAEGIRKPEEEIYRLILKRLEIHPPDAVFIDDKPRNVAGALRVGIQAIVFESSAQVKNALRCLGVMW